MASAGPNSPGTASTSIYGNYDWTNPSNALSADAVYTVASSGAATSGSSYKLNVTNFGFSIPSTGGNAIQGFVIEVKCYSTTVNSALPTNDVYLIGGTGTAANLDTGAAYPTSNAYLTYGSATELGGKTWTIANVNSSAFGVAIAAFMSQFSMTSNIDHVRITVYYGPPASGSGFMGWMRRAKEWLKSVLGLPQTVYSQTRSAGCLQAG